VLKYEGGEKGVGSETIVVWGIGFASGKSRRVRTLQQLICIKVTLSICQLLIKDAVDNGA
jgi:hypothetical protein